MRYVSATEAKQKFTALLDASQRGPVMIRRRKRDMAVLLSLQEYERLRALGAARFQRFCDRVAKHAARRGVTARKLAKILGDGA